MDDLTPQETAAVLAGLRLLQRANGALSPGIEFIATGSGEHSVLSNEEIDGLCERVNCKPALMGVAA